MKDLRTIRIFLATLFFIGAVAYLAISETIHPMARIVPEVQIVPSLLASGLGAIVVWFGITFLFREGLLFSRMSGGDIAGSYHIPTQIHPSAASSLLLQEAGSVQVSSPRYLSVLPCGGSDVGVVCDRAVAHHAEYLWGVSSVKDGCGMADAGGGGPRGHYCRDSLPAVARGLLPADGARILHHGMPDRDGIGMLRR